MEKKGRIYEVPVNLPGATTPTVYLVEAERKEWARQHVADKLVGDATVADGRRIHELGKAGVEVETARGGAR